MKVGVAGLVLLALALLTSQRAAVWTSERSLWEESLRQMPFNARALINAHRVLVGQDEHERICDRLGWLYDAGRLTAEERWFTDRICLLR